MSAPRLPGVSQATLEDFLDQVAIDFGSGVDVDGQTIVVERSVKIVGHEGRHVSVRRKDGSSFPPWLQLCGELLGNSRPCEMFSVDKTGFLLTATLKTTAQEEADDTARELDHQHALNHPGEKAFSHPIPPTSNEARPQTAREIRVARKKGKTLSGTRALVVTVMQEVAPTSPIKIEDLVEHVVTRMPLTKDVRGLDRREEYAGKAVNRLVHQGWLFVHGDDQEKVGLLRVTEVAE